MFLINFFHSVSFFTSHLIKHIFFRTLFPFLTPSIVLSLTLSLSSSPFPSFYLSLTRFSIGVFLSTFVYRFYDFKKYIFIDFPYSRMCFWGRGKEILLICISNWISFYPYSLFCNRNFSVLLWRISCYIYHIIQHLITSESHRCSIFFTLFS